MPAKKPSRTPSLAETKGEIADAEINKVVGGATNTKLSTVLSSIEKKLSDTGSSILQNH